MDPVFDEIRAVLDAARARGRLPHRIWLGADHYRAFKAPGGPYWAEFDHLGGGPEHLFGVRVLRGDHLGPRSVEYVGL